MASVSYYKIFTDTQGYYRWKYVASNGETIAVSSEAYVRRAGAEHGINLMKASSNAPVI